MNLLLTLRALSAIALATTLAACGSGGGSTETATGTGAGTGSAAAPGNVNGTVAVGAPLINATVTLLCGDGKGSVSTTTDGTGKYKLELPSPCAVPFFLKAEGKDPRSTPVNAPITLYAFGEAPGTINITSFTDIAAAIATGGSAAAEFEAVRAATTNAGVLWTPAAAADAKTKLLALLTKLNIVVPPGLVDVLHSPFNANGVDALDKLLDALLAARGSQSLGALAESVAMYGGTPADKPWNVLFPKGVDSLSFPATGCYGSAEFNDEAGMLTLSRSGTGSSSIFRATIDVPTQNVNVTAPVGAAAGRYSLRIEKLQKSLFNLDFYSNDRSFQLYPNQNEDGSITQSVSVSTRGGNVDCMGLTKPVKLYNFYTEPRLAALIARTKGEDGLPLPLSPQTCDPFTFNTGARLGARALAGQVTPSPYDISVTVLGNAMIDSLSFDASLLLATEPASESRFWNESVAFDESGLVSYAAAGGGIDYKGYQIFSDAGGTILECSGGGGPRGATEPTGQKTPANSPKPGSLRVARPS